jgi:hypothetical protein
MKNINDFKIWIESKTQLLFELRFLFDFNAKTLSEEKIYRKYNNKIYKLLGIKDKNKALGFLRKSRIILQLCWLYIMSITAGAVVIFLLSFGLNYSLVDFFLFGISWTTILGLWYSNGCMSSLYFAAYFFIIYYNFKQSLNSIRIELNIIRIK